MGKQDCEFPLMVKVGHTKSSCKLNIPIALARKVKLDQTEYVILVKKGDKKVEVKRYDSNEDYEEYVPGNKSI